MPSRAQSTSSTVTATPSLGYRCLVITHIGWPAAHETGAERSCTGGGQSPPPLQPVGLRGSSATVRQATARSTAGNASGLRGIWSRIW